MSAINQFIDAIKIASIKKLLSDIFGLHTNEFAIRIVQFSDNSRYYIFEASGVDLIKINQFGFTEILTYGNTYDSNLIDRISLYLSTIIKKLELDTIIK